MALVLNDRVKETSTSTGTSTINLGGAVAGFETFVAGIGNSNTTYYAIVHKTLNEFEIGIGTITDASPDTLTGRSNGNVLSSSNSDNVVDFSAGDKDVFCTQPASKAIFADASNNVTVNGGVTLTGDHLTVDNGYGISSVGGVKYIADSDNNAPAGGLIHNFYTDNGSTSAMSIAKSGAININSTGFYLIQDSSESLIRSESQPIILQTYASSAWNDRLTIANNGNATFAGNVSVDQSGGTVTLDSNGHVTSHQKLNVISAGGRLTGTSSQGDMARIDLSQTTANAHGGYLDFQTANTSGSLTQALRIDKSQNATFAGNVILSTGNIQVKTTGQIEENNTRLLLRSTGDASGIRFDASEIIPFKNGSADNGNVSLGASGSRFKDLHLQGIANAGGFSGKIHPVNGVTTNYLSLKDSNELNFYNSSDVSQTLHINYDAGNVNLAQNALELTSAGGAIFQKIVQIVGSSDTTNLRLRGRSSDNNFYTLYQSNNGSSTTASFGTDAANDTFNYQAQNHHFQNLASNTTYMRIDSSANVTIPAGDLYIDKHLRLRTTDDQASQYVVYNYTDDTFRINYNGAGGDEFIMNSSGDVTILGNFDAQNINFSSDNHSLQSYNTNNPEILTGVSGTASTGFLIRNNSGNNPIQLYRSGNDYGFLGTAWGSWDTRKTVGGSLYLNNNTTYYLNPASTTKINYLNILGTLQSDGSTGTSGQVLTSNGGSRPTWQTPSSGGYSANFSGYASAFSVGTSSIGSAGEIRATSNITAYYSDERLKDFHGKIENAVDKVKQLNGYYFSENDKAKEYGYENQDKKQVGVSAQEVEQVLPEIVSQAPFDIAEDGTSKSGDDYKTVNYEKLVPLLIEAIKEQQLQIDNLKETLRGITD